MMRRVLLRHMFSFGLACSLMGGSFVSQAHAQEMGKAIEFAYPDLPVWTLKKNDQGEALSPFVDYARELFQKAEIPLTTAAYPPKRVYSRVIGGESAFGILVDAPILKDCCVRSKAPVGHLVINVYSLKGAPRITSQDSLLGNTVVLMHGYTYGKLREFLEMYSASTEIVDAANYSDLFTAFFKRKKASRHREIYVVSYEGPSEEILAKLVQDSETKRGDIQADTLFRLPVNLVLSKSYPDAEKVMQRLERIASGMDIQTYIDALAQQ